MPLRHIPHLFVLTMFFCFLGLSAHAITVKTIRGAATQDKTRLVLELDDVTDFGAITTDNPARLIVELPAQSITDRAGMGLGPLGVTSVRHTRNNDIMRIEFSLKNPVTLTSAFMLEKDGEKPNRLVIDFRPCSGTCPALRPFGTLTTRPSDIANAVSSSTPTTTASDPAALSDHPEPHSYTIVIDAGHGGKDPGAIGVGGAYEKNVTLAAAKQLADLLRQDDRYKVILTRTTDRFILLHDRVKIARAANADLFISLHADMAPDNRHASGLSIYTLSDKSSDEQTEKLAAQENKVDLLAGVDLSNAQEDVANILIDLAMRENMNQSRFLAGKVVTSMNQRGVELIQKPHRYAGFAVLKAPDIPSVLVEMGFLSNPSEARRLQTSDYRADLMRGLKNGVDAYFKVLEKR